jgi:epoxyqueuosine reductase
MGAPPQAAGSLVDQVIELCKTLGFAAAGIADAAPTRWRQQLIDWLEAGKQGSMGYLSEHLQARLDPNLVLPGARSAIMVADLYAARGQSDDPAPAAGRIARYARGRDYHIVMRKRLHRLADELRVLCPEGSFRAFVDTAPVMEREYAARAGLGWIGKHTLLIHPRLGSYTLLGGILTTLPLQPPDLQPVVVDHCGTCTRCIDACPTGAISPYSVDASRCISYLTIERREPIDAAFHESIGDWLYGCDICQEVCPHNTARPSGVAGAVPNPAYVPRHESLPLLDVLGWTPSDRSSALQGSAMKRATLAMMKRNALIVAANHLARHEDDELRERLAQIAEDPAEPAMVRDTARLSCQQVRADSSHGELAFNPADGSTMRPATAASPGNPEAYPEDTPCSSA